MKIKKVYLGTQQIRPESVLPGDRILFYYPLQGDIKDHSGNGYDLTKESGSYTDNGTYITIPTSCKLVRNDSNISVNMNNKSYTFACTLRNFPTNYSESSYQCAAGLCTGYFTGTPEIDIGVGLIANGSTSLASTGIFVYPFGQVISSGISITGNERKKIIVTYDHTTSQSKVYLGNELKTTTTISSKQTWTGVTLFYRSYGGRGESSRYYRGDAKNFILTEGVWTTEDINRYIALD